MTKQLLLTVLAVAALGWQIADAQTTSNDVLGDAKPCWAAIVVPSAEASASWYERNLHFQVTKKMDLPDYKMKIVFLRLAEFNLELIERTDSVSFETVQKEVPAVKDRDRMQGFVKLGFMIRDVDKLAADLKREGVPLRMQPTNDAPFGVRFLLLEDNAGNLLQFFQPLK